MQHLKGFKVATDHSPVRAWRPMPIHHATIAYYGEAMGKPS